MTRRKPADEVSTIFRGGPDALRAAADLLRQDARLSIRCSAARLEFYREAAARAKLRLTEWVLRALDEAARGG